MCVREKVCVCVFARERFSGVEVTPRAIAKFFGRDMKLCSFTRPQPM